MLELNHIHQGNCLELIKNIDDKSIDLIITDPPYGVSYKNSGETYMVGDTVNLIPYILPEFYRVLKDTGAIYMFSSTTKLVDTLPIFNIYFKLHSIIIWDKRIGQIPRQLSHKRVHPTQKPIEVTDYILENSINSGGIVLDPFIGSGTTAVSCIKNKCDFIGMEIESKYVEIANKRIADFKQQLVLV